VVEFDNNNSIIFGENMCRKKQQWENISKLAATSAFV